MLSTEKKHISIVNML